MAATAPLVGTPDHDAPQGVIGRLYALLRSIPVWVLWIVVAVWSIPTG